MKHRQLLCLLLFLLVSLSGCVAFNETHFFKSTNRATGEVVNYFKIEVRGSAMLTRSRYVSGFYDERAVDLYFNDLKPPAAGEEANIRPIFLGTLVDPGTGDVIKPLSPDDAHGTFMMIFSNNARSVADAIGQFAENREVTDAMTNLLNRDVVRQSRRQAAQATLANAKATAISTELTSLFGKVPSSGDSQHPADEAATRDAYVRILNSISRSMGSNVTFTDIPSAKTWLDAQRLARR